MIDMLATSPTWDLTADPSHNARALDATGAARLRDIMLRVGGRSPSVDARNRDITALPSTASHPLNPYARNLEVNGVFATVSSKGIGTTEDGGDSAPMMLRTLSAGEALRGGGASTFAITPPEAFLPLFPVPPNDHTSYLSPDFDDDDDATSSGDSDSDAIAGALQGDIFRQEIIDALRESGCAYDQARWRWRPIRQSKPSLHATQLTPQAQEKVTALMTGDVPSSLVGVSVPTSYMATLSAIGTAFRQRDSLPNFSENLLMQGDFASTARAATARCPRLWISGDGIAVYSAAPYVFLAGGFLKKLAKKVKKVAKKIKKVVKKVVNNPVFKAVTTAAKIVASCTPIGAAATTAMTAVKAGVTAIKAAKAIKTTVKVAKAVKKGVSAVKQVRDAARAIASPQPSAEPVTAPESSLVSPEVSGGGAPRATAPSPAVNAPVPRTAAPVTQSSDAAMRPTVERSGEVAPVQNQTAPPQDPTLTVVQRVKALLPSSAHLLQLATGDALDAQDAGLNDCAVSTLAALTYDAISLASTANPSARAALQSTSIEQCDPQLADLIAGYAPTPNILTRMRCLRPSADASDIVRVAVALGASTCLPSAEHSLLIAYLSAQAGGRAISSLNPVPDPITSARLATALYDAYVDQERSLTDPSSSIVPLDVQAVVSRVLGAARSAMAVQPRLTEVARAMADDASARLATARPLRDSNGLGTDGNDSTSCGPQDARGIPDDTAMSGDITVGFGAVDEGESGAAGVDPGSHPPILGSQAAVEQGATSPLTKAERISTSPYGPAGHERSKTSVVPAVLIYSASVAIKGEPPGSVVLALQSVPPMSEFAKALRSQNQLYSTVLTPAQMVEAALTQVKGAKADIQPLEQAGHVIQGWAGHIGNSVYSLKTGGLLPTLSPVYPGDYRMLDPGILDQLPERSFQRDGTAPVAGMPTQILGLVTTLWRFAKLSKAYGAAAAARRFPRVASIARSLANKAGIPFPDWILDCIQHPLATAMTALGGVSTLTGLNVKDALIALKDWATSDPEGDHSSIPSLPEYREDAESLSRECPSVPTSDDMTEGAPQSINGRAQQKTDSWDDIDVRSLFGGDSTSDTQRHPRAAQPNTVIISNALSSSPLDVAGTPTPTSQKASARLPWGRYPINVRPRFGSGDVIQKSSAAFTSESPGAGIAPITVFPIWTKNGSRAEGRLVVDTTSTYACDTQSATGLPLKRAASILYDGRPSIPLTSRLQALSRFILDDSFSGPGLRLAGAIKAPGVDASPELQSALAVWLLLNVIVTESGGRAAVSNRVSSAAGLGQIVESTWKSIKESSPSLNLPETLPTHPKTSEDAIAGVFSQLTAISEILARSLDRAQAASRYQRYMQAWGPDDFPIMIRNLLAAAGDAYSDYGTLLEEGGPLTGLAALSKRIQIARWEYGNGTQPLPYHYYRFIRKRTTDGPMPAGQAQLSLQQLWRDRKSVV